MGHKRSVDSVAWSPDGQTIVSSSEDANIKLWSKTGTLISTLTEHESTVNSVAWSPDGQTLASASNDNTIKLWQHDSSFVNTLKGHKHPVLSIAWSPDGQTLASGSSDSMINLWQRDGTLVNTLKSHGGTAVTTISWSPNGQIFASGSNDNTVKIWNRDGTLVNTLTSHEGSVRTVAWSPDGQTLASSSNDKTIKLWNRNGSLISTLKGHGSSVTTVAWSPDGRTLASGSEDNTIKLWFWQSADLFAMGCYWLQISHRLDSSGLAGSCNEPAVQSAIPLFLQTQAQTHARNGSYSLAEAILHDIKARNPRFDIPSVLAAARKTASQALLTEASKRLTLASQPQVSNGFIMFNPSEGSFGAINPTAPNFDLLTQAYLEEANFLVRRAHSINPDLNLNQELKQIKDQWQESVKYLKSPQNSSLNN
jgi:uncharacterized protein with WD repeat